MILRFPPSPTGNLTIGNIFILINLLNFNLKNLKYLLIRIDDTDKKRLKFKFIKNIIKKINNININYKNLFFQSNKNYYYFELLQFIYKKKKIYLNKNYKIIKFLRIYKFINFFFYIKKKKNLKKIFSVKLKKLKFNNYIINNFFFLKFDNSFSYNYSSIIDDINSNVKFVLRGLDHINNIKKQIILLIILKKNLIKLIHFPLLLEQGKKLSKRNFKIKNKNYKIFFIYFYKTLSFIKIINNFNIKKIKTVNYNLNFIKILKIKDFYEKLVNLNHFNKNLKFIKKIINIKIKFYIKYQKIKNFKNFLQLNKINYLNINFIKKYIFKNLFLNKKFFIYLDKSLKIKKVNFYNYNKYKNLKIFKKIYFILIKSLKILIMNLNS